jgi:hypothetical protein
MGFKWLITGIGFGLPEKGYEHFCSMKGREFIETLIGPQLARILHLRVRNPFSVTTAVTVTPF